MTFQIFIAQFFLTVTLWLFFFYFFVVTCATIYYKQNREEFLPAMEEEFDLLAGHDLGESAVLNQNEEKIHDENILVWHKMETKGFQPSAREVELCVRLNIHILI